MRPETFSGHQTRGQRRWAMYATVAMEERDLFPPQHGTPGIQSACDL